MDEDGKYTELAGPELKDLCVMSEGTDKGNVLKDTCNFFFSSHLKCIFCFYPFYMRVLV